MGFGTDLRDQLPDINQYTSNGIQFLQDLREFLKERVLIEQQYSQAIDKLAKTYIKKFKKSGQSFYGASAPFALANPEIEALGTCAQAFLRLLTETETMAKSRSNLAEKYAGDVSGALKFESKRKDDARAKHMNFASQLSKNYDAQKAETDSIRSTYKNAGRELDAAFLKYEKSPDDKTQEKAARDWNDLMLDKVEKKNDYVLSLAVLNAHKQRYYFTDMPILMDHMQTLNEHITQRGREIMFDYVNIDNQCLNESLACNSGIIQALEAIDSAKDSMLFIQLVNKPWIEPPNFPFEPCADLDKSDLQHDVSNVHVLNTLQKVLTDVDTFQKDGSKSQKDMDGLKNLKDAYEKDPKLGDPVEVWQNVIEAERTLLLKDSLKLKAQTQVDVIRAAVGDIQLVQHQQKSVSSGTCVVCTQSLSLFSKGYACTACNLKCHVKCFVKVPPRCGVEYTNPPQIPPVPSGTITEAAPTGGATKLSRRATTSKSHTSLPSAAVQAPPSSTYVATAKVLFDFPGSNPGELTVREGDVLNVLELDDGNGWMTAEVRGNKGVVPSNYVEVQAKPSAVPTPSPRKEDKKKEENVEKVRAIYDYAPQSSLELQLTAGDIIEVTNKNIGGGWWEGKLRGTVGQFPENYVEPA